MQAVNITLLKNISCLYGWRIGWGFTRKRWIFQVYYPIHIIIDASVIMWGFVDRSQEGLPLDYQDWWQAHNLEKIVDNFGSPWSLLTNMVVGMLRNSWILGIELSACHTLSFFTRFEVASSCTSISNSLVFIMLWCVIPILSRISQLYVLLVLRLRVFENVMVPPLELGFMLF